MIQKNKKKMIMMNSFKYWIMICFNNEFSDCMSITNIYIILYLNKNYKLEYKV